MRPFIGTGRALFGGRRLGPELVTNGGFADGTGWVPAVGWTIGSGVATCDGTSGFLRYTSVLTVGGTFDVSITVTARTAGSVSYPYDGTGATYLSAPGTYTMRFVADTIDLYIHSNLFAGAIDNVSVRKVL